MYRHHTLRVVGNVKKSFFCAAEGQIGVRSDYCLMTTWSWAALGSEDLTGISSGAVVGAREVRTNTCCSVLQAGPSLPKKRRFNGSPSGSSCRPGTPAPYVPQASFVNLRDSCPEG